MLRLCRRVSTVAAALVFVPAAFGSGDADPGPAPQPMFATAPGSPLLQVSEDGSRILTTAPRGRYRQYQRIVDLKTHRSRTATGVMSMSGDGRVVFRQLGGLRSDDVLSKGPALGAGPSRRIPGFAA